MKRCSILIFMLLIFCGKLLSQTHNGILNTGFVIQIWSLETLENPVSETTFPIDITYSVQENLNIQFSHSPAMSRFGTINLSGLSDTWIRSTYAFSNNRALVSAGVGLPTGKTRLNASEMSLSTLLSLNAFKFRMPVFGQGFTMSAGIMYAYPVNENVTIGIGANYVFRGKYRYSQLLTNKYDPGDQIGINIGFDYLIIPNLQSNIDFIFNYYTADKLNNTKMFTSGAKFITKIGLQYQLTSGYLWMRAYHGSKAKNETWNGQALVPDDKNFNITIRELELGARYVLTEIIAILASTEVRSYKENDIKQGWVDLYGIGLGYELQMSERFGISMGAKLFFGDGEFMNSIQNFSGFELLLGTQWKFE